MKVGERHFRSIWREAETGEVRIIDQRWLPHEFRIATLETLPDFATAIRDMWVRGAPLIGAAAAHGLVSRTLRVPGRNQDWRAASGFATLSPCSTSSLNPRATARACVVRATADVSSSKSVRWRRLDFHFRSICTRGRPAW